MGWEWNENRQWPHNLVGILEHKVFLFQNKLIHALPIFTGKIKLVFRALQAPLANNTEPAPAAPTDDGYRGYYRSGYYRNGVSKL